MGHDFKINPRNQESECSKCGEYLSKMSRFELEHCPVDTKAPEIYSVNTLTFGDAIEALKAGRRVARKGWNGKGMWLVLIRAGNAMHITRHGSFDMQDCIGMKTATNVMQPGWLASQADMLAEDWEVVG